MKADRSTLDTQEELKRVLVEKGIAAPPQGKPIRVPGFKGTKKSNLDGETFENATE